MRKSFINPVILLSLIALLLFVSSCEKDVEINESDLIGTWDIGQASVDVKVGPISLLQFLKTALQLTDQQAQDFIDQYMSELDKFGGTVTFNADYSYQMLNGDFGESGTWRLEGDKLYLTITGENLDDAPLKVEHLDSSSALFAWEEDQEVDIDEDSNSDFTATIFIELNLSRQ